MSAAMRCAVLAGVLAAMFARAAGAPLAEKGEGAIGGRKAVELSVADTPGWKGSIVLYILERTDGGPECVADVARPMEYMRWDGHVLHLTARAYDVAVRFEMGPLGGVKAELRRLAFGQEAILAFRSPRYHDVMRSLTISLATILALAPLAGFGFAAEDTKKAAERLNDAAALFSEIMGTPDKSIPQSLLDKAQCIVLVPGLKKGAFIVGGKFGKGFAACRNTSGQGWGPPAAIRIEGGSVGFQIGASSSDVVLLVMNERGMRHLTTDKFTIGADATAAVGPVGRNATAQTDAMMSAEILSWSRSRGAFAGISLDGATLRNDLDENQAMYGQRWTSKDILGSGAKPPAAAARLLSELNKYSPR